MARYPCAVLLIVTKHPVSAIVSPFREFFRDQTIKHPRCIRRTCYIE